MLKANTIEKKEVTLALLFGMIFLYYINRFILLRSIYSLATIV